MIRSNQRRRMTARSFAVFDRQAGNAAAAAAIASRVSVRPKLGTVPSVSPVAGSSTTIARPAERPIQRPSIRQASRKSPGSLSSLVARLVTVPSMTASTKSLSRKQEHYHRGTRKRRRRYKDDDEDV